MNLYSAWMPRRRRAAKRYDCDGCDQPIYRGTAYITESDGFPGDMVVHRWHPDCYTKHYPRPAPTVKP